jgi:iron complex outermembrane recepter protein
MGRGGGGGHSTRGDSICEDYEMNRVLTFRNRLMLAGSCVLAVAAVQAARAADTGTSTATVSLGLGQAAASPVTENVISRQKARLLKEKNSPSGVTELGARAIQSVGIAASTATLLRQAPSVYVYQQGLGDNAPELTVRGVRGLEIASTLDGVPTQDLLAPGSFYLANNIGGVFTNGQISGVHVYPGTTYPDKNTFGTIGGTIAFDSKRPTNDRYFDVVGSVGSFGTYREGFEANSGAIDSPLGTGDNALKVLLNYYNFQSQGFIDYTPVRENEMEFALDKPYNDGLSKFQATVIYNQADGLIQNEPVPIPYLQKYGMFTNYPTDISRAEEKNDNLTIILHNNTYVNDYLSLDLTAFYIGNDNELNDFGNVNLMLPGGQAPTGDYAKYFVGGSLPFFNNPGGFGFNGRYGPAVGGDDYLGHPLGIYNGGYGGYFYSPTGNTYNPYKYVKAGTKECPQNVVNSFGGIGFSPCGINDQITGAHSDTYGIQPRATIILPDFAGIANTIKVGALIAKETSPEGFQYLGSTSDTPEDAGHQAGVLTGGTVREIYQGYIQDKIDFFDNTLHITPGGTIEGTYSNLSGSTIFRSLNSPYYGPTGLCGPNGYFTYYAACAGDKKVGVGNKTGDNINRYGYYSQSKWDREVLPFFNISYDFDKILPSLAGLSVYASTGQSALFAPVTDFGPRTSGPPPYASIVHLYEGGVQFDTSRLFLHADYFYQKVDRDFGFFSSQTGTNVGASVYSNDGQREMKGFEAAGTFQLTPEWQLFGNVSYTLAKWLKTALAFTTVAEDQYGTAIKGTRISGVPDWLSTFGVDYTKKSLFVDNDGLDVRFTGQYTGQQATTCDLQLAYPSCGNVYIQGVQGVDYSGGPKSNNVFDTFTGATVTDQHGGIAPFATFSLDANYTLPTPTLPVLKSLNFDVNIQNLFDQRYYQYYYKQISPSSCGVTKTNPTGNPYGCTPEFADGIPGEPFSVFFTVKARF